MSKVLFILTANNIEKVPAPLLDRLEIIELSSYTIYEKVSIAKYYLIPNLFIDTMTKAIEPIMLIVIGGIVLVLAFALYLPLFQSYEI